MNLERRDVVAIRWDTRRATRSALRAWRIVVSVRAVRKSRRIRDAWTIWHRRHRLTLLRPVPAMRIRASMLASLRLEAAEMRGHFLRDVLGDQRVLTVKLSKLNSFATNFSAKREAVTAGRIEADRLFLNWCSDSEAIVLKEADSVGQRAMATVAQQRRIQGISFLRRMERFVVDCSAALEDFLFEEALRRMAWRLTMRCAARWAERREIRHTLFHFVRARSSLEQVVKCTRLALCSTGVMLLRTYLKELHRLRPPEVAQHILRRASLLRLAPAPVKPIKLAGVRTPRVLSEVRDAAKSRGLPEVLLQRELTREQSHIISVRILVRNHRVLRDFFGAWAAFAQEEFGKREAAQIWIDRCRWKMLGQCWRAFSSKFQARHLSLPERSTEMVRRFWLDTFVANRVAQRRLANAKRRELLHVHAPRRQAASPSAFSCTMRRRPSIRAMWAPPKEAKAEEHQEA